MQPEPESANKKFPCASYQQTFKDGLECIREEFCDARLVAGGKQFKGHKVILAANSKYFYSIFVQNFNERESEEIRMPPEIDTKAMKTLLDYFYSGQLALSMENIESTFIATDYMRLDELLEISIGFMEETLHPSNCIRRYVMAARMEYSSPGMEDFRKAASVLIAEEAVKDSEMADFFSLSAELMLKISKSASQSVEAELLYMVISKWVVHDEENRRQFLYDLLQTLPVDRVSNDFFTSKTRNEELLRRDPKCVLWLLDSATSRLSSNLATQNQPTINSSCTFASGKHSHETGTSRSVESLRPEPVSSCSTSKEKTRNQPNALFVTTYYSSSQKCLRVEIKNATPQVIYDRPDIDDFSAVSHQKQIYLLCGSGTEKSFRLDDPHKPWVNCELDLKFGRHGAGCVVLGDNLFVVGGADSTSYKTLSSCMKFDFGSGRKENLPSMSEERERPGVAVYANSVYVTGGYRASPMIFRFDAREGEWFVAGRYTSDMGGCSSATVSDFLYTSSLRGTSGIFEQFDFRSNQVREIRRLPKYEFSQRWISSVEGDLFCCRVEDIFKYEAATDEWEEFSSGVDLHDPIIASWT